MRLQNINIKNVSVNNGAELTRLYFDKVFTGDKSTIESLENFGTIQRIEVNSAYLAENTASKIEEIKNHGKIGNISSINIGTLSSDAGSIKSITMSDFQIDKIDLKGTALGDATASRADGPNGILVTGSGKIGTGQGDAITIDANSSIAGFSIESLTEETVPSNRVSLTATSISQAKSMKSIRVPEPKTSRPASSTSVRSMVP